MKTIDWNAVYAIGALGGMLAGMIWGLAWKMSGRFTRIDGKLDRVGRGQRALCRHVRELFTLHEERIGLLEDRLPAGNPDPHRPAAFGGGLSQSPRASATRGTPWCRALRRLCPKSRNPQIPESRNPRPDATPWSAGAMNP